ncbi:RNA 2',3'-cyclic phosphodiesterase [Haloferax mediterranei ATCC 33500]|uniref:RNA 2',3'-cyclic phosphodiesterase n=1 Tax=Haloferax mediterranei (strain ATCC 33500 / DSM 1411 / JCM 8866 / NBRC 14739 / NCIMB 2177 / R-4) TaxID=523841 RepID=I3R0V6_HALMT|nr:RNA 2',3'-cyclic phosphodiesterase [Haloferax mediterranei]AFK17866.1 2'-5' RNA ligase [Haloferax mediterranei ATCC 33500]AHZ22712.1 2'-5' RNA ligase [Haloferax mediterranei ATCC 33500]EMA02861.1 2'-5' RNA ligase [Haloferax mediterranei ATCC 33500]MDX5987954.1 RNA 2',3'-cyclic phosphodiesterase [Haloferax mediterranei ATCC 33500]QCQ74424.1 RNA 2',3'-cyclic phosphodiesterase [Haloferax mediterranei ATCC 33500]
MRLFLAIDLPSSLSEDVAAVQELLSDADSLQFTDPEQAHVTLKFLGETSPDRLDEVEDAVEDALDAAAVDPFDASVGGLGVFPSLDYIRVIWTGVTDGADEMTRLHEALERETTALGFDAEDHEFSPHITLARMNDARWKAHVRRVVEQEAPTIGTFRVREVRLKKSELGPNGPEYGTVARFSL